MDSENAAAVTFGKAAQISRGWNDLVMTATASPGWYPDGSGQRRYWDGNKWTMSEAEYASIASHPTELRASEDSSSPVASESVVRYVGRDGSLLVEGEYVVIEHNERSIRNFRVRQSSITAVHFEPATRSVSGIVTIAVDGAPLVVPTGTNCGSDLHTVVFKHSANDLFYRVHAWLKRIVANNVG